MKYLTDNQYFIGYKEDVFADFGKENSSFLTAFGRLKLGACCSKVYVNYLLLSALENNVKNGSFSPKF